MKTFALHDGDFVLGPGGFLAVGGIEKVRQDLGAALREPYGSDRFHPGWGSTLVNFVGDPASVEVAMLIRSEVTRIVQNYIAVQADLMQAEAAAGRRSPFSSSEVVVSVDNVDVNQQFDRFLIRVSLRTLDGAQVTLVRSVGV